MPTREIRRAGGLLAMGAIVALAACSKKDAGTYDTGMVGIADTGMAPGVAGGSMAAGPAVPLTDANIFYVLDKANMLDSATGAIAVPKGTSADVREYAQMMMREHHALRQQGQALATKFGVTMAAPANDNSQAELDRTLSMLNGASKGRDFDKAYIDNQVTYHVNLLATATTVMQAAQNPELQNFIQKAAPTVQAHLDSAQAIQQRRGGMQ